MRYAEVAAIESICERFLEVAVVDLVPRGYLVRPFTVPLVDLHAYRIAVCDLWRIGLGARCLNVCGY